MRTAFLNMARQMALENKMAGANVGVSHLNPLIEHDGDCEEDYRPDVGWTLCDCLKRTYHRLHSAEQIMRDLNATFEGRDADGAPGADGSYWLGHMQALTIWFWLHPELLPEDSGPLNF